MFRTLSADWLKTKRTAYRGIAFLLPPAYALAMLWYISVHRNTPSFQEYAYAIFFDAWAILVPLLAALLAGLLGSQEEQAGNFNGLMGSSVSRVSLLSGKLFLLILTAAADLLASVLILLAGMVLFLHIPDLQIAVFLEGALLVILGFLALSVFHSGLD